MLADDPDAVEALRNPEKISSPLLGDEELPVGVSVTNETKSYSQVQKIREKNLH